MRSLTFLPSSEHNFQGEEQFFFSNVAKDAPELLHLLTFASYKSITISYATANSLEYFLQSTSQLVPTFNHYFGSWFTDTIFTLDSVMNIEYFCIHSSESPTTHPICSWSLQHRWPSAAVHLYRLIIYILYLASSLHTCVSSGNLNSNTPSFDCYLFMPIFSFLYFIYSIDYQLMVLHGKLVFQYVNKITQRLIKWCVVK